MLTPHVELTLKISPLLSFTLPFCIEMPHRVCIMIKKSLSFCPLTMQR